MNIAKSVFVVGTTASGKSEKALNLAEELGAVILNCDSIQVYRHLEIGSAQPSPSDKQRVPHHLFSYVEPPQEMTAGTYRRDHFEILKSLSKPVFVVGGTGFYFQALEKGMYDIPAADQVLQKLIEAELKNRGEDHLWEELREKDPESAKKIHPRDHYRLVRALELIRREGRSLSAIKTEFASRQESYPRPHLKVGFRWPKEELEKRIRQRSEEMLKRGLVEEVRGLLDEGLESWAPLASVGYREVIRFLQENRTQDWLSEEITRSTWQLAKKQRTWFQRDPEIIWFEGSSAEELFREKVLSFLEA